MCANCLADVSVAILFEKCDKLAVNLSDDTWAFKNHARDELDKVRTALDLFVGVLGRKYTTNANNR